MAFAGSNQQLAPAGHRKQEAPLWHWLGRWLPWDVAKRRKPAKGKAATAAILKPLNNSDKLRDNSLTSIFYAHNFALTGGQEMEFTDPDKFYDKPVTYRTFFQQAVEEIG